MNSKAIIIGVITLLVIGLGVLTSIIGNVGIRSLSDQTGEIVVTQPLLPGVPFTARWSNVELGDGIVLLTIRSSAGAYMLGQASLQAGHMQAQLPCEVAAGDHQLVLVEQNSRRVLATTITEVLAPGPDCAH